MSKTIVATAAETAKVVLVVDDEFLIRWSLRSHLTTAGYCVLEADNLQNARALLTQDVDVVLLDLLLPDGNGMDLLEELQARLPRVAVIMLSAHATHDIAERALAKGAFQFLHKPFELETIAHAVEQATADTQ